MEDLGDITVTTSESKTFYIEAGTYTIIELGSDLESNDVQTVTISGTELTRVVAESNDPFGLDEGTVYYVRTITVTAGYTLTYSVTNKYAEGFTMPLTGQSGTWPFILVGLICCIGSGHLFYRRY